MISKFQYISQPNEKNNHIDNIKKALDAGCDWIQLRIKNQYEDDVSRQAEVVKKLCDTYQSKLIINDFIKVAKAIDADGVHLGLTDDSIINAKFFLGEDKIIGGTANTLLDVTKRINEGVSYIGLGPFAFTTTKQNLSPILGLQGYKDIISKLKEKKSIPLIAIGGILEKNVDDILAAGIYGIAFSSLLTNHANPKKLIAFLKNR